MHTMGMDHDDASWWSIIVVLHDDSHRVFEKYSHLQTFGNHFVGGSVSGLEEAPIHHVSHMCLQRSCMEKHARCNAETGECQNRKLKCNVILEQSSWDRFLPVDYCVLPAFLMFIDFSWSCCFIWKWVGMTRELSRTYKYLEFSWDLGTARRSPFGLPKVNYQLFEDLHFQFSYLLFGSVL